MAQYSHLGTFPGYLRQSQVVSAADRLCRKGVRVLKRACWGAGARRTHPRLRVDATRRMPSRRQKRYSIVKFLDPNRFKGLACRTSQTSFPNILRVGVSGFRAYCMVGLHWQVNCAHTDGLCDRRLAIGPSPGLCQPDIIYPPSCCCTSRLLKRKCRHNHDYAVLLVVPVELTTTRRSSAPPQALSL
jgi:hypothetical protein